LLVTVDTLRPDALGWVSGAAETPALDRLAAEGFRFPAAWTPVPLTLPAHASLLTGLIPPRHGVRDNGQVLPAGVTTLAERLRAGGRVTAAFVSGYPLEALFGLDRGFDRYDDTLPEGEQGWVERRAEDTADAAIAWLETAPEPWFAWVHFYDPHDPYDPPRAFWRPGPRGAYDGEVTYADLHGGRLLAAARRVASRPLLTVFTADHGEALGEHRERSHGYFVYDSTMRVPLVFNLPGLLAAGQSAHPARLVDVVPTVLELLGEPAAEGLDGVSLVPTLAGGTQPAEAVYLETRLPWVYFGWAPLTAVVEGGWKLIRAPRPELYDLGSDPGETDNRVDTDRRGARELADRLRRLEARPGPAAARADDPEVVARLRALGYVGAGGGHLEPPAGLPDPKDRIEQRETLLAAEDDLRAGRPERAIAGFDAVLAVDPDNRFALLRSGVALLVAGRTEAAARRLHRAVTADPDRAEARFALGDALMRLGEPGRAVPQWMELVRLQPRRFEGWFNLGEALAASGEPVRAAAAFAEAAKLPADEGMRRRLEEARRRLARGAGAQEGAGGDGIAPAAPVAGGGDGGSVAAAGGGGAPATPATCEAVRETYERRLEEAAACDADGECRIVAGDCADGLGGCWYAVGGGFDEAARQALVTRYRELGCTGRVCRCAAPPPGAECRGGRCRPTGG
jgi:arylsulfatase A-like enzyme